MNEFQISTRFLNELARSSERLVAFAKQLSKERLVSDVIKGIDCRIYDGNTIYEQFVEAKLDNGSSICWWIDIGQRKEQWEIEGTVSLNADSSSIIRQTAHYHANTIDELSSALKATLSSLLLVGDITYKAE